MKLNLLKLTFVAGLSILYFIPAAGVSLIAFTLLGFAWADWYEDHRPTVVTETARLNALEEQNAALVKAIEVLSKNDAKMAEDMNKVVKEVGNVVLASTSKKGTFSNNTMLSQLNTR